jgi:SAM-dependent methyltransferase
MKGLAKTLARALALLAGLAPFALRRAAFRALLLIESRIGAPDQSLRRLFALADDADRLIAERATSYGGGVNPKHRLTGYHDFFVERIKPGAHVLDLGCGIGEVARSIASRVPDVKVTAVDSDPAILAQARALPSPANLTFVLADATAGLPQGSWDAVVLSNVLEHIERRVDFLKSVVAQARPKALLIRVPLFERHWHMPLRRELGVDFRSDPTHFIEHTLEEFERELSAAGLGIAQRVTLWGEIWAVAEPIR